MTWQYNLERGDITDPDVPQEQCHFTYPETYAYYGGEVIAERGRLFVNAPAMLDLLKRYVADDPCAPADPRYAEVAALIERIERIDNPDEAALDMLHRISARLNEQFQMDWPREWAQANLRKRKLSTFFEHGQWWVEHRTTGAQWSVCDAEGLGIIGGFCFEQVTRGEMEKAERSEGSGEAI